MSKSQHTQLVDHQFGQQAAAYLTSSVHAQGEDLQCLQQWLAASSTAEVLDIGCGAGHASFTAAPLVSKVIAYDLSSAMLAVVEQSAKQRQLTNIDIQQGPAEHLPFADQSFDIVISRYSAHHWHDVPRALREIKRVLKPAGQLIMMDIAAPGLPLLDIWLQSIEVLRDPSHVRNYSPGEWLQMTSESCLRVEQLTTSQLDLDFAQWIARMKTPLAAMTAIRALQQAVSEDVQRYYQLQSDGSFTTDTVMFRARRVL